MAAASSSAAPPLGKYLASSDKKTRDKAIKNLSVFLSEAGDDALPRAEIAKLWKGLFYCFWMSDKPLVQQALATELAGLLLRINSTSAALAFLRGFWEATVREWSGLDKFRMDKFYMLVRRFVNASFRFLRKSGWSPSVLDDYTDILTCQGGPLCPRDVRVPSSLTFHVADVYWEELNKVLGADAPDAEAGSSDVPCTLLSLLAPFLDLLAHTPTKATYQHVQEVVLRPLVDDLNTAANMPPGSAALAEDGSDADENLRSRKRPRTEQTLEFPHIIAHSAVESGSTSDSPRKLRAAVRARIFAVASSSETRDANRRRLYAFWKAAVGGEDDEDES